MAPGWVSSRLRGQYKVIQCNIVQYSAIQYNTVQYNAIQYRARLVLNVELLEERLGAGVGLQQAARTIQCNTIQYIVLY